MEDIRRRTTGPSLPFQASPRSNALNTRVLVATGGITLGGTSTFSNKEVYTSSGGIVLSGTSAQIRREIYTSGGGLLLSGTSTYSTSSAAGSSLLGKSVRAIGPAFPFQAAPRGIVPAASSFSYTATGGMTFGGSATFSTYGYVTQAWIGRQMGPALDFQSSPRGFPQGVRAFSVAGTGGLTISGSANLLRKKLHSSSGGIILSGAASVGASGQQTVVASGRFLLSGAGVPLRKIVFVTSGGMVFSGSSDYRSIVFGSLTGQFNRRGFFSLMKKRR